MNGLSIDFVRYDLRDPEGLGTFDVVVVTDALFSHEMPRWVARGFARHLAPDGIGLLVDPGRAWSDRFVEEAVELGLSLDVDVMEIGSDAMFAVTVRWAAAVGERPDAGRG